MTIWCRGDSLYCIREININKLFIDLFVKMKSTTQLLWRTSYIIIIRYQLHFFLYINCPIHASSNKNERAKIPQIHDRSLSWLVTGTSINSWMLELVLWTKRLILVKWCGHASGFPVWVNANTHIYIIVKKITL